MDAQQHNDDDLAVNQRHINAATAAPPVTIAPNSIFALGAAAADTTAQGASVAELPPTQRPRRNFTEQDFLREFDLVGAMSMAQVAKRLDVSKSVANRYVKRLADSGQLREAGATSQGAALYESIALKGWGEPGQPKAKAKARARVKARAKVATKPSRKQARPRVLRKVAAPAAAPVVERPVAVRAEASDDTEMVVGLLSSGELLIECKDAPDLRLSRKRTRALWMYLKQLDVVLQA